MGKLMDKKNRQQLFHRLYVSGLIILGFIQLAAFQNCQKAYKIQVKEVASTVSTTTLPTTKLNAAECGDLSKNNQNIPFDLTESSSGLCGGNSVLFKVNNQSPLSYTGDPNNNFNTTNYRKYKWHCVNLNAAKAFDEASKVECLAVSSKNTPPPPPPPPPTTCLENERPNPIQQNALCSSLGSTYSGNYTVFTPYICSGTRWVLGTSTTNNSSTSCTRQCPGPMPQSEVKSLSCADKLGANYEGQYYVTTPYVCSTSTWSWGPSQYPTDNSSTACKIRDGICGPNSLTGSLFNDFNQNPKAWCDVGSPIEISGEGVQSSPYRWRCQIQDGAKSSQCEAKLCRKLALEAGFYTEDPNVDRFVYDIIMGFTAQIGDTNNADSNARFTMNLGCSGCSQNTDPKGFAASQEINGANNSTQFFQAFSNAVTNMIYPNGVKLADFISVSQGDFYNILPNPNNIAARQVILEMKQPGFYFASDVKNGWFTQGAVPSGIFSTNVKCKQ